MTLTQALIVEPSSTDVLLLLPILSLLGFQVAVAETFQEAKGLLRPSHRLLVTEVRLGEFNGLHLVLRAHSLNPQMAAIVTSGVDDPVLRAEAEAMGATFVLKPLAAAEAQAAVVRTVLRKPSVTFEPIRAPFERRSRDRRTLAGDSGWPSERRRLERRTIAPWSVAERLAENL